MTKKLYQYKARDAAGKLIGARLQAESKEAATQRLKEKGYLPIQIIEAEPFIKSLFNTFARIPPELLNLFYIQLADMLQAGISLLKSLQILHKQQTQARLKALIHKLSLNIEAGESFSESLAQSPIAFPKLFVNMMKAGEASGKLGATLHRFASFAEQQTELKRKIRGALFYPIILLCAGIGAVLFIVTWIIPQFAQLFSASGMALPIPTQILSQIGLGIQEHWLLMAFIALFVWFGFSFFADTKIGKRSISTLSLNFPITGPLYRDVVFSRFAMTLGTLIENGVPILSAIDITKEVVGNVILAQKIANISQDVEKGEHLGEAMKKHKDFPLDMVQMIAVGEESGKVDEMLKKIASIYEVRTNHSIKKLTTLIEPLLMVVMGGFVAFIMISLLLPIFDMVKLMRH